MNMVVQNMFHACKKGNITYIDKTRDRLTLKILENSRDEKGNSGLYLAVSTRQKNMIKYLLDRGISVNSRNENGNTPLHKAFMNQDYETIGILMQSGGDNKITNDFK